MISSFDARSSLSGRLERLFPLPVAVEAMARDGWSSHWLLPAEARQAEGWAPRRRLEFSAGRHLARRALARLGAPAGVALPRDGDRLPCWPAGFSGSISHCDDLCVAVVTRQEAGVGIDVERADRAVEEIAPLVCLPRERAWLEGREGFWLVTLFSLKESIYKALFPRLRQPLEFHDLLLLPGEGGHCRVEWQGAMARHMAAISGRLSVRYLHFGNWVFSAATFMEPESGARASR